MDKKWIILGICGVTNGGKTTLSKLCKKYLPNVRVIAQDMYFLLCDDPRHVLVPELNHFNWELISSLDMEKMYEDIQDVISNKNIDIDHMTEPLDDINISVPLEDVQLLRNKLKYFNILVLEGFSIFNYGPIEKLCDLKFYLTLDRETCLERRSARIYDPPDVPGYFEKVVWPEHLKQLKEVQENCKNIVYLSQDDKNHLSTIFTHLLNHCKNIQ